MKKHLLTGLVVLLPIALTLMIVLFLVDFFTAPIVSIVDALLQQIELAFHFKIPEQLVVPVSRVLSLITLFLFILFLGVIARGYVVKKFLDFSHRILSRIPLIKTIYKVSKDIFSALFSSDGKKAFKNPVIIPFPFSPSYALGFHAGEVAEEIQKKINEPLISVFMPTSPHPISGFLFFVPEKDAPKIAMTTEEAVKFLVSCGMIHSTKNE
ncbi:MAG TPA: DUF502 domain-containing protein [Chlamydiales bacterium]|nr:DUF502 domain-containing protein [Chlamydiales bacterium]